jgi:hypothetical protein
MLSQALAKVERGEPGSAGDMDGPRPYFRDYIELIKVAEETARMVQLKLAAIVAADVVKLQSPLMGTDEEGTLARLRA